MNPADKLNWIKGLRAGYESIGATQSDQYSWLARTGDSFVFTAEIDHIDPARNQFDFAEGTFHKKVLPLSLERGDHALRVRHAQELLDAVGQACSTRKECRLLLLRGTKYGTTTGGVHSAVDLGSWIVESHSGAVDTGFQFLLKRTQRQD